MGFDVNKEVLLAAAANAVVNTPGPGSNKHARRGPFPVVTS